MTEALHKQIVAILDEGAGLHQWEEDADKILALISKEMTDQLLEPYRVLCTVARLLRFTAGAVNDPHERRNVRTALDEIHAFLTKHPEPV
jgi:hypothetical protein